MDGGTLERFDTQRMHEVYDRWPRMAADAYESGLEEPFDARGGVDEVVLAGMGGSGAVGDVIASILSETGIRATVVKGYRLPSTAAGAGTLVIPISVSGNTDETAAVLRSAWDAGCRTVSFSSGGSIQELCERRSAEHRRILQQHSPRASFASFLFSVLGVLRGMLPVRDADVRRAIGCMESRSGQICSQNLAPGDNPSLSLAAGLTATPVIYYPVGLQAAATRFKNSLQENAKMHCAVENVIEACHNGIVPWERPSGFLPVLIRGTDDFVKTQERWSILKRYFEERSIRFLEVSSVEGDILAKICDLVYTLDYASIYRAVMSGIDPAPIGPIDFVKERLGKG